ncbi:ribbon-helix-helix domain-containing protein [Maricaulis sp.]|uniref:ribbon-helix-helix domain-containing protein n=1 Tax=Maricaulis sp. TaxID=1486257 RepID=UPI003A91CAA8
MRTINISLPGSLKAFVHAQVAEGGYGSVSEYLGELIRKDMDLQRVRGLLLEGARSAPKGPVDAAYFADLRARAQRGDPAG